MHNLINAMLSSEQGGSKLPTIMFWIVVAAVVLLVAYLVCTFLPLWRFASLKKQAEIPGTQEARYFELKQQLMTRHNWTEEELARAVRDVMRRYDLSPDEALAELYV
jgi:hypothetical protein